MYWFVRAHKCACVSCVLCVYTCACVYFRLLAAGKMPISPSLSPYLSVSVSVSPCLFLVSVCVRARARVCARARACVCVGMGMHACMFVCVCTSV